ncbi:MAG: sulfurtransferase TusA family protein, partial [Anaerolineae bacterium]
MNGVVDTARKLDLRGEVCPYTFVKTILTLEKMDSGQVLEVVVDYAPAADNVPLSVTNRGHSVLEVQQTTPEDWMIRVRK